MKLFAICVFAVSSLLACAMESGSWKETEISFGLPEWPLNGTLTVPSEGSGRFPLVVLVHGSGPHDRDETIGPNRPFRDIAHDLAGKGVATLRYEKRTRAHSAQFGRLKNYTLNDEVIDDAVLAVGFAAKCKGIDPSRIFVLGHSLGGMLLPRIAAATAIPAGYIFMAAPARPMKTLMREQIRYLIEEKGGLADALVISAELGKMQRSVPSGYWEDFSEYIPLGDAGKISVPMLFLQGGRDYQVTVEDFELWRKAMGDRPGTSFRLYRNLNHLMQKGIGKSTPQEYLRPQRVDSRIAADIAAFVSN